MPVCPTCGSAVQDLEQLSEGPEMELVKRLNNDLKTAAAVLDQRGARMLVDYYYQMQKVRTRAGLQLSKMRERGAPNDVLVWFFDNARVMESDAKRALNTFAQQWRIGNWLMSIVGIGPVLSAGLLAHVADASRRTASRLWRFAGLDMTVVWEEGKIRPWSARLKQLAYKVGESFIKQQSHPDDIYGKLYVRRHAIEWERNLSGEHVKLCAELLQQRKRRLDEQKSASLWMTGKISPEDARIYLLTRDWVHVKPSKPGGMPMLTPGHINRRAILWVKKIFFSHVHDAMWMDYWDTPPPVPWVMANDPVKHTQFIPIPNWPYDGPGKRLTEFIPPTRPTFGK